MIATATQLPGAPVLTDKQGPFDFGVIRPSRYGAFLAVLLGFLAFLPYPAIPAGRNSAIQAGNILTVLMVLPCLALPWRRRPFIFYPLLMAPLAISSLQVAALGGNDPFVGMKSLGVWALSCLTMVATQLYAPRYGRHLMLGIAVAALIHVGVGLWQVQTFASGDLPLVELYVNPSFLSVQERAHIIARYIQRPFGLFPEPSAMSSSLAPWVLLWLAEAFGVVRFRQEPRRWHRALFVAAAAGALLLIVLSRSGHAMVTVAGAVLVFLLWFKNSASSARTYALLLLVLGILLPGLFWLTANALYERVNEGGGNGSWDDRAASIAFGFNLLIQGNPVTILFGLGTGQSALELWDLAGLDAVWSVTLTYLYETGLVGAAAVGWIGWQLVAVWRATRAKVVFAMLAGVWLVGMTVTTSYQQLLPLWVAFGWLTVWPEVCEAPPPLAWARRAVRHSRRYLRQRPLSGSEPRQATPSAAVTLPGAE
jgi:hypothetical protein